MILLTVAGGIMLATAPRPYVAIWYFWLYNTRTRGPINDWTNAGHWQVGHRVNGLLVTGLYKISLGYRRYHFHDMVLSYGH